MVFTTPTFLVFLLVLWPLYWSLSRKRQNVVILLASLVFYGWWDWRFVFILLGTAITDYWVAVWLDSSQSALRRRGLLLFSLATNLGSLGFFKYYNFFAHSFQRMAGIAGVSLHPFVLNVMLPVGISFYTFQALSYTIDVYRKRLPATHDFVAYLCFISFFPHMVAGPIQRASHFLEQFENERAFDLHKASDGCRQMLWGFFKKMVVADNIAPLVSAAYHLPASVPGNQLLIATYLFAVQIYCDFSGYTDIAIGCSRLFGFDMTRNFAYPYFASSINEFWHRWHISLTSWFQQYLYIPLGGNRCSKRRHKWNVLLVFVISGLWHGANWTFVAWGLLNGLMFLMSRRLCLPESADNSSRVGPRRWNLLPEFANIVLTFHLVCLGWVFFRAESLGSALVILERIIQVRTWAPVGLPSAGLCCAIGAMFALEWLNRDHAHALNVPQWPRLLRYGVYYATVAWILCACHLGSSPFIYFQF